MNYIKTINNVNYQCLCMIQTLNFNSDNKKFAGKDLTNGKKAKAVVFVDTNGNIKNL